MSTGALALSEIVKDGARVPGDNDRSLPAGGVLLIRRLVPCSATRLTVLGTDLSDRSGISQLAPARS